MTRDVPAQLEALRRWDASPLSEESLMSRTATCPTTLARDSA